MQQQDYTVTLKVKATAEDVFNKINNVTSWWTEDLEGDSKQLNGVFTVRFFDDIHVSTQQLVEVIPHKKIVWLVTDSTLTFIQNRQEWTNTSIHFDIEESDTETVVTFTHIGLVPAIECYTDCTKGWDYYIKESLFKFLTEGTGIPELKQKK